MIDDAVQKLADDLGVNVSDIPVQTIANVRNELLKSYRQGKGMDASALLRKQDFEALGIKPLRGQITREPAQFAQERNLRGVMPQIQERMTEQNRALQNIFGKPAGSATEAYEAGGMIKSALEKSDEAAKNQVSKLYQAARDSQGRYAEVNHLAFVEQANKTLDEQMLGRFLPEQARNLLNDIAGGKVPLNVNNLVQVDSVLSAAQRAADDAGAKAIGVIREALHEAPIASTAGAEAKQAFDVARTAAREMLLRRRGSKILVYI